MKKIPVRYLQTDKKESAVHENLSIRDVRSLLNGKDMLQELHRHDFFYILALKKGVGHHEIDFIPHHIVDHVIFFLRPGQVHQLNLKKRSSGYLIEFNRDFYSSADVLSRRLLRSASGKNFCRLDAINFKKLMIPLTSIFQEYTGRQEGYLEIVKANLTIFFTKLIRQRKPGKRPSDTPNPYAQERLEEFLELLESNLAFEKHVSQYADRMNLSTYQLNSITKTILNKTCSELIDEYCILESKRYLLATSNRINQIAFHLGFEDASYFIRFFKKHTGQSPESFRKNFR